MRVKLRAFILTTVAVLLAIVAGLAAAIIILRPGPEGRIVLASGGSDGAFNDLAKVYQADLARYGVNLELRPDIQGGDTLKGMMPEFKSDFKNYSDLNNKNSDIQAGFMKGGVATSMQGRYATDRQQVWHQRLEDHLRSVGRLFYEPLWVFVRTDESAKGLRDLKGKKVWTGVKGSGTAGVSRHLLMANGVDAENSKLIDTATDDMGALLLSHDIDALMIFLPPESPRIQALLHNHMLRLMDFAIEADAYLIRFPSLAKVVLRQGSVELSPDIPVSDVTLLASSVALVVRSDLDPSLETLLAHAVMAHPKSTFDKSGEPILFSKAGEFPSINDPEYQVSQNVRQLYKTGEMPMLLQSAATSLAEYKLPFWPAAFLHTHGSQVILFIVPALSILYPLYHFLPQLYRWGIRRRLLGRYRQLKSLEASIDANSTGYDLADKLQELDRIEAAVSGLSVPLPFSDQVYDLRGHIDIVRRRLEAMLPQLKRV